MKTSKTLLLIGIVLTAAVVAGCAGRAAPTPTQAPPTESLPATPTQAPPTESLPATPTAQPASATDALIDALRQAGATVERGDTIVQPFFSPIGQIIRVNGLDVQVFEYPDAEAAGAEAAKISPDGSQIGTTIFSWVDPPRFYRKDNLIVLYVGRDTGVADLLEGALGAPIAEGPGLVSSPSPAEPAEELIAALNARDWAGVQAHMGDTFLIGYWRSEGVSYSRPEAVQLLQTGLLPGEGELTFTTDESQFPSLDGIPLASIWGPDVQVARAVFSQGWGPDGRGEAILALVERPDGSTYWYGMLYAGMGFE